MIAYHVKRLPSIDSLRKAVRDAGDPEKIRADLEAAKRASDAERRADLIRRSAERRRALAADAVTALRKVRLDLEVERRRKIYERDNLV